MPNPTPNATGGRVLRRHEKLGMFICIAAIVLILGYFVKAYAIEPMMDHEGEVKAVENLRDRWSKEKAGKNTESFPETETPLSDGLTETAPEATEEAAWPPEELRGTDASLPTVTGADACIQEYSEEELSGAEPMALCYVPRWGADYVAAVRNSVTNEALKDAVGHYSFSAQPGGTGNCVLAAHRSVKGGLFARLPEIQKGDLVTIETRDYLYTYQIYSDVELVEQTKVDEIAAIPHHDGYTSYERYITMQACEIGYNHMRRLIVHGTLLNAEAK